jgi:hypothetical protein
MSVRKVLQICLLSRLSLRASDRVLTCISVKLVSKASAGPPKPLRFPAVCRTFLSEPPRTRTWNLEIKSLSRSVHRG